MSKRPLSEFECYYPIHLPMSNHKDIEINIFLIASYPSVCLEVTDNEVTEYYQPKDFRIGSTIYVYGRRFLLLDCDPFTRKYYADVLKSPQNSKLKIEFPKKPQPKRVRIP